MYEMLQHGLQGSRGYSLYMPASHARSMYAGTGTVINKSGIKQYQQATRDRSKVCTVQEQLLYTLNPA